LKRYSNTSYFASHLAKKLDPLPRKTH